MLQIQFMHRRGPMLTILVSLFHSDDITCLKRGHIISKVAHLSMHHCVRHLCVEMSNNTVTVHCMSVPGTDHTCILWHGKLSAYACYACNGPSIGNFICQDLRMYTGNVQPQLMERSILHCVSKANLQGLFPNTRNYGYRSRQANKIQMHC